MTILPNGISVFGSIMLRISSYNPVTPIHLVVPVEEKSKSPEISKPTPSNPDTVEFSQEAKQTVQINTKSSSGYVSSEVQNGLNIDPKKESIDSQTSKLAADNQRQEVLDDINERKSTEADNKNEEIQKNNRKAAYYESTENASGLGRSVNLVI